MIISLVLALFVTASGTVTTYLYDEGASLASRLCAGACIGLAALGLIGFVLASVGLHGLIAQTVIERRREYGIRLTIGAAPMSIVKLVVRRAALVLSVGLAAGLALAWSSGRLVESQLFGITSRDPMPYAVAALLMVAVVILASISPAIAATRVDPIEALKSE